MRSRIMYVEDKSQGMVGHCRIGRVRFSKTGATLYYGGRAFQSLTGRGFKANYFDTETGNHFWISGPRRDGADGLYGRLTQPEDVDDDVRDVYWSEIRGLKAPAKAEGGDRPVEALLQTVQGPNAISVTGWGRKNARMGKILRQRQAAAKTG